MKTKERKVDGEDEFGNYIYGVGYIYYWGDIGWLLGPNLYTYSYWSDGKEGCAIIKKVPLRFRKAGLTKPRVTME